MSEHWVSILNALVIGVYGWVMCIAGRTDRVMLGAVAFIATGITSWIWVPIGSALIEQLQLFHRRYSLGDLAAQSLVFTLVTLSVFPTLRVVAWNLVGLVTLFVLERLGELYFPAERWAIAATALHAALAITLFVHARAEVRPLRQPGHCICGYDLTGLSCAHCPECGTLRGTSEPAA